MGHYVGTFVYSSQLTASSKAYLPHLFRHANAGGGLMMVARIDGHVDGSTWDQAQYDSPPLTDWGHLATAKALHPLAAPDRRRSRLPTPGDAMDAGPSHGNRHVPHNPQPHFRSAVRMARRVAHAAD